jgi:DNA-3-methyladenine glycosylase I
MTSTKVRGKSDSLPNDAQRCTWAKSPLMTQYHDLEWGVPINDDQMLFEFLILEGAQAGLSWETVLKKRQTYREVFDNFDAARVARYQSKKIEKLMEEAGIIRNRLKINAAVENAQAFLAVQDEFGSFNDYIWQFVNGKPRLNRWKSMSDVPASAPESDAMSRDLKKRKFKFVGTTICYAFMQATGMVNDHIISCFRHSSVLKD